MNESYAQDLCRLLLLRDMGVVCVQTCNCAIEFGAVVVEVVVVGAISNNCRDRCGAPPPPRATHYVIITSFACAVQRDDGWGQHQPLFNRWRGGEWVNWLSLASFHPVLRSKSVSFETVTSAKGTFSSVRLLLLPLNLIQFPTATDRNNFKLSSSFQAKFAHPNRSAFV